MFTLFAPAKINLALDVLYQRPDGYHEIDSVMQTIALADQITFEIQDRIELTCSDSRLPTDERNLAWKAVKLLQEETGTTKGIKLHITKNIPLAAGLAGGSSDAASVLIGLNQVWGLGLSREQLMRLGGKIGADVPFCISQGTARAQGIGEKLSQIKSKLNCSLLLVTPNIEVSTADAYKRLRLDRVKKRPKVDQVVTVLEAGKFVDLTRMWGNVFEEVILKDFPEVAQVKKIFQHFGLTVNLMSGSGPSVYALNPPPDIVETFVASIPPDWFCCLTHFL